MEQLHEQSKGVWLRRLIPFVILGLGLGGAVLIVKSRKPPARVKHIKQAMLVEVMSVRPERRKVQVTSNGVIQPRREVSIASEVVGKVKWINPALMVGGMMRAGAVMLSVDEADYKLAVQKARSAVALAEKNLAVAESNARVARTEWARLGQTASGTGDGKPNPLTLHEPQLKAAQSSLASAKADLERAKLDLSRTTIKAPFSLRVRSKNVDRGQYVRQGQELARIYGTDVAEVIVPLPVNDLRWLNIPRPTRATRRDTIEGPPVAVRLKTGAGVYERQGFLVRSVGEVDPTGRMSKVVVALEDPYNLKETDGQYRPEFEIGAFVEVALQGKALEQVFVVPADAVRPGSVVWVAGAGDKLQIKTVTTARRDSSEVLISSGLKTGDKVILSAINGAVEGMQLRVTESRNSRYLRPEAHRPEAHRPEVRHQ
jgi:RND family efflux transporter MFP subunit